MQILFSVLLVLWTTQLTSAVLTEKGVEMTANFLKNTCKRNTKAKEEEVAAMKDGKFSDTRELNCYMACALNLMKVMKNKKIDPQGARQNLQAMMPEKFKVPLLEQLSKCEHLDDEDSCLLASQFVKCCYEVNPNSQVVPY